jgi:hypothetical protein
MAYSVRYIREAREELRIRQFAGSLASRNREPVRFRFTSITEFGTEVARGGDIRSKH